MTTAPLSRSPAREDASHCPPLATRPLTLRAWPSHPDSSEKSPGLTDLIAPGFGACEIDWLTIVEEPAESTAEAPPPPR